MTYYIKHDHTGTYWDGENWQEELTVSCIFTDYDEALKNATINDLTNYKIIRWE